MLIRTLLGLKWTATSVNHLADNDTIWSRTKPLLNCALVHMQGESHKDAEIAKHIGAHICKCQAFHGDLKLGGKRRQCTDSICYYFRWFYPYHHNQCNYACFKSSKDGQLLMHFRVYSRWA